MRQQAGLTLTLGALCLIIACARRKPPMVVLNQEVIRTLGLNAAWDNYIVAQNNATDERTSRFSREIWAKAAKASLDRHFELIETARIAEGRALTPSPARLDIRSACK